MAPIMIDDSNPTVIPCARDVRSAAMDQLVANHVDSVKLHLPNQSKTTQRRPVIDRQCLNRGVIPEQVYATLAAYVGQPGLAGKAARQKEAGRSFNPARLRPSI